MLRLYCGSWIKQEIQYKIDGQQNMLCQMFYFQSSDKEKDMRDTFNVMDKDGEGFITAAAMKVVVTKLGK